MDLKAKPWCIDTHCHLGAYDEPLTVARSAGRTVVIAMTESPEEYRRVAALFADVKNVRIALGLHPLRSAHRSDLDRFKQLLPTVEYVGEIGMDCSQHATVPAVTQRAAFERILEMPGIEHKVMSVHSRKAEAPVVDCIVTAGHTAILHWYTGSLAVADRAIQGGLYFSFNIAMVRSKGGLRLLDSIPVERVLTESDGPFVRVSGTDSGPNSVVDVIQVLGAKWAVSPDEACQMVQANMQRLRSQVADGSDSAPLA
jgi:TatD DNase family protein